MMMQSARHLIFAAGLGLSFCAAAARAQTPPHPSEAPAVSTSPPAASASGGLLAQIGRELSELLLQNRDGVVGIRGWRAMPVSDLNTPSFGNAPPDRSFPSATPNPFAMRTGYSFVIGSGFLVQGDMVVTTAEVGEDIINPVVFLADGKHVLRVVARSLDKKNNIALFKVTDISASSGSALHPLRMGDSDSVLPGMLAVTVGDQAGWPTSGGLAFIAQTGRQARSGARFYPGLIQFQGAVGPGSSGSPLLGPTGEVIGMVIAAPDFSPGGYRGGAGRGRDNGTRLDARPGDAGRFDKSGHAGGMRPHKTGAPAEGMPKEVSAAFQQPGRENGGPESGSPAPGQNRLALMGAVGGSLSNIGFALPINVVRARIEELARASQPVPAPGWIGLTLESGPKVGAYVRNLYNGSPADSSGLEVGDLVTQVDGHAIHAERDFFFFLRTAIAGQTMRLQIQRGNATRTITVRLTAKPDDEAMRRMTQRVAPQVGLLRLRCHSLV